MLMVETESEAANLANHAQMTKNKTCAITIIIIIIIIIIVIRKK